MPGSFNYAVYKKFNSTPHYPDSDTSGDTIPLHNSSSDGHRPGDSNHSVTTSDQDGIFEDSDNEPAALSEEPHLDLPGFSDADDDSYVGYGPVDSVEQQRLINDRVNNFDYMSNDSDDEDGYTDSPYRFSLSTTERGEITDPATDSHEDENRRATIEEIKARNLLYTEDAHGNSIHINPAKIEKKQKNTPDAFDYSYLRNALTTLNRSIGYGGIDGDHKLKDPNIIDKFDYLKFSGEYPDDCIHCGDEHPDHKHHVLDHPHKHDHHHDGVDEHGVPFEKPDHHHDGHPHDPPPAENLTNAHIARNILDQGPYFEWALEDPESEPHPDHKHHVLDHPHKHDHDHDFAIKNLSLEHGPEIPEPDHDHEPHTHPHAPPESIELANFYRYGGTVDADFNKYTWEDRKVFPPEAHPAPYAEDLYYRDLVLQDYQTYNDRPYHTNYGPTYGGHFETYSPI